MTRTFWSSPAFAGPSAAHHWDRIREERKQGGPQTGVRTASKASERSKNKLRPTTFDGIVGQERTKALIQRVLDNCRRKNSLVDHILMIGPSGTGKSTFANIIASYLEVDVFQVSAPVSMDTLLDLREQMQWGDFLFVDEIHLQAVQERRGKSAGTEPEIFYQLLEDRVVPTPQGMVEFPDFTVIGATTDPGLLPEPFLNRFPLTPVLEDYTEEDMLKIARMNAEALSVSLSDTAARMFAGASRCIPRVVNGYVRNAESLSPTTGRVNAKLAREVLHDLNGTTEDGLDTRMQKTLTFLYTRAKRKRSDGEVVYQASVSSIATAIGLARDQKAVQLHVEPYLVKRGFLQVGHGGRTLTDAGIARAQQLLKDGS